jgi:hypothetical protein
MKSKDLERGSEPSLNSLAPVEVAKSKKAPAFVMAGERPRQRDYDCGLYAIMFAICVSKCLALSLITRKKSQCFPGYTLMPHNWPTTGKGSTTWCYE